MPILVETTGGWSTEIYNSDFTMGHSKFVSFSHKDYLIYVQSMYLSYHDLNNTHIIPFCF